MANKKKTQTKPITELEPFLTRDEDNNYETFNTYLAAEDAAKHGLGEAIVDSGDTTIVDEYEVGIYQLIKVVKIKLETPVIDVSSTTPPEKEN